MIKNYQILRNCLLFTGIDESSYKPMLDCLSARQKKFSKNSFVFMAGEKTESLGVVLTGAVHVIREDYWGKRKIVSRIDPGGLVGEAFACAGAELPVSVMAAEDCEIMFLKCSRILTVCSQVCGFHTELNRNLSLLLAQRNIELIQKMEYITQTTTREKLLAYLSEQARAAGGNKFDIPFDRGELADFLSVERSAMSAELSKMRRDRLIICRKNHFELTGSKMDRN
ncbi:MAG: Crp/Fnr family transcriptional regulator [Treponema sp.]|nr:Crp/Fnr family transcriptional regulator [Treponema sp.]